MFSSADLERLAETTLDRSVYDSIAQGAGGESTIKSNREAIESINLLPRVLQNVTEVKSDISVLEISSKAPIIIGPTAHHQLVNPQGKEVTTAKAAEATGTIMIVSTCSNVSLEEIAANTHGTLWFQLYSTGDEHLTKSLIRRAEEAGYKALVITVDTAIKGDRRRDIINKFETPKECKMANFSESELAVLVKSNNFDGLNTLKFSAALAWHDISWIKQFTKLPIIIKGILHPDDAKLAVASGVSGIVISNHGGRQLDGVLGTLDALPNIVEVVNQRIPIFIDGGFRSGSDIFKAIAMGATAVLIGRPVLYALATNKLSEYLNYLQQDFKLTMGLMGCVSVEQIKKQGLSLVVDKRTQHMAKLEKLFNDKFALLEQQLKASNQLKSQAEIPRAHSLTLFNH